MSLVLVNGLLRGLGMAFVPELLEFQPLGWPSVVAMHVLTALVAVVATNIWSD